jgi:Terminase small subunit
MDLDGMDDFGPAMMRLTAKQRGFVKSYVDNPMRSATQIARSSGYSDIKGGAKVRAHELMHNENVLAAIHEETGRRFKADAALGRGVLVKIALTDEHPQQVKAASALIGYAGFSIAHEQKITVEHQDKTTPAMIEKIRELAKFLEIDPAKFLGANEPKLIEAVVVKGEE